MGRQCHILLRDVWFFRTHLKGPGPFYKERDNLGEGVGKMGGDGEGGLEGDIIFFLEMSGSLKLVCKL